MALYKVEINQRVRKKDLTSIPTRDADKIIKIIADLAVDPFPSTAIQLKGREEWRIRQGDYRILYIVAAEVVTVYVVKVGHRKEVYRK